MITVEKLEKGTYFDDAFKISFRYDPTTVAKVKELAERRYLPEDRAWEIPAHELPALIEKVGLTALRPSKKILSDEDPTSKKTLPDTSKNFLLNKDSKDNIEKSISKEMEGKAPKKRSYSTILEDPVNKFVKEALSKFIQYCRGKNYTPKVTTVEKFASTLRDNAGEDPVVALAIVDQSIDKGWKDLYPLKNYGRQGKPTAISKKFSGNTLKDAEGKDIVFK